MSQSNGDKARYCRQRKQKRYNRARSRQTRIALQERATGAAPSPETSDGAAA